MLFRSLAARGQAGVDEVLTLLKADIDRTLAQIGCPDIASLSADFLHDEGRPSHSSAPLMRVKGSLA